MYSRWRSFFIRVIVSVGTRKKGDFTYPHDRGFHYAGCVLNSTFVSPFRRSLPLNSLTIKCDSSTGSSSSAGGCGTSSVSSSQQNHAPRTHDTQPQHHYSNVCISTSSPNASATSCTPSPSSRLLDDSAGCATNGNLISSFSSAGSSGGDYYFAVREQIEEIKNLECEDSSTLSDEDCTPHVSRSNSRGNEVVVAKLRYSSTEAAPSSPATSATSSSSCVVRGRVKRKEERAAHRSRSLPPPPPYRPPPPATSRRAPITSYYLGDCSQMQKYVITRTYMDEESYVWTPNRTAASINVVFRSSCFLFSAENQQKLIAPRWEASWLVSSLLTVWCTTFVLSQKVLFFFLALNIIIMLKRS